MEEQKPFLEDGSQNPKAPAPKEDKFYHFDEDGNQLNKPVPKE